MARVRRRGVRVVLLLSMLASASIVFAQPPDPQNPPSAEPATRAEALRQERADKEQAAQPYKANTLERTMHLIEERGVPLLGREGFYVRFGNLTTGSGFAYGGGYRGRRLLRRHGNLDLWAAASLQGYWATEARVTFPRLANGYLHVEGYASRRDYPKEDFFGIGPGSRRDAQSDYLLLTNAFGGRAGVRPNGVIFAGGGLDLIQPHIGRGKDNALPSMADRFDETTAPGLSRQPDFLRTSAFVEVDYRQPRNARKGGFYRLNFSHYDDRDFHAFSFNRVDVDLQQFVSILAERRVFAGRAWLSTSDVKDGQAMPFYMMPTLGGHDTLRGFRQYRFRGPHALLLQAEYRWEIWSGFEGALFYDTGKVAERRSQLDLRDLERDYGIGFRFNTDNGIIVRVDAGFGSRDGKHLYIVFGGVF